MATQSSAETYTDPKLRDHLKEEIQEGDKGGKPGQWSARKAQLLAHEYEEQGGGYQHEGRTDAQQHLEEWTELDWRTEDGKPAQRGDRTARYLPAAAWEALTAEQRKATNAKKLSASAEKQYVSNTAAAQGARAVAEKQEHHKHEQEKQTRAKN